MDICVQRTLSSALSFPVVDSCGTVHSWTVAQSSVAWVVRPICLEHFPHFSWATWRLHYCSLSSPALLPTSVMNTQKGLCERTGRTVKSPLSSEASMWKSRASWHTALRFAGSLAVFFFGTLKMASSFFYYSTMKESRRDSFLFRERLVIFWT